MKLCAIGTGAISKSMIHEFHRSSVLECVAVCSRGEETGKAIAEQFGLEKVYTSLDAMLADPEIEMVYIGSPNAIHYSQTKAALLAGKVSPVLDPAYKGGALMDINLYNIHFTVGLFGAPENIRYRANLHSNGVDTSGVLTMEYPDFLCQCVGAKDSAANNGVQIVGEEGYMEVTPSASNLLQVKICLRGKEPEILELKENPWYYEVQDISRIIAEGNPEVCYADLETTRKVVAVLEAARKDAGLGF